MKKFKLKINTEFEVESDNKDLVYEVLENQLARENTTAENQFWDNIEIEEIDGLEEFNNIICNSDRSTLEEMKEIVLKEIRLSEAAIEEGFEKRK